MKLKAMWMSLAASLVSFCIGYWAASLGINKLNRSSGLVEKNFGKSTPITHVSKTNYSFTEVSILCWVMTSQDNLFKKAIHIAKTWGPRCNKTLYVTEGEPDRPFPGTLVTLPVGGDRRSLWFKTRAAFTYIYDHYRDKYDWFIKVDDDTFVIVDNLRYFLASKDTNAPFYYGCKFHHPNNNQEYASGGAGYVLGKEALSRFVRVAYDEFSDHLVAEDVKLARYLSEVGVSVEDSLDSRGRLRFLVLPLEDFIVGNLGKWLSWYMVQNITSGLGCCSHYLVTMHYVKPDQMYLLEYITQHFRLASTSRDHYYRSMGTTVPI